MLKEIKNREKTQSIILKNLGIKITGLNEEKDEEKYDNNLEEEKKGKDYLLRQIHSIATDSAFISQINFEPQVRGKDVVLISGVGDVFPFMRVHSLLEAMQPHFSNIPILVLYPGKEKDFLNYIW